MQKIAHKKIPRRRTRSLSKKSELQGKLEVEKRGGEKETTQHTGKAARYDPFPLQKTNGAWSTTGGEGIGETLSKKKKRESPFTSIKKKISALLSSKKRISEGKGKRDISGISELKRVARNGSMTRDPTSPMNLPLMKREGGGRGEEKGLGTTKAESRLKRKERFRRKGKRSMPSASPPKTARKKRAEGFPPAQKRLKGMEGNETAKGKNPEESRSKGRSR